MTVRAWTSWSYWRTIHSLLQTSQSAENGEQVGRVIVPRSGQGRPDAPAGAV